MIFEILKEMMEIKEKIIIEKFSCKVIVTISEFYLLFHLERNQIYYIGIFILKNLPNSFNVRSRMQLILVQIIICS